MWLLFVLVVNTGTHTSSSSQISVAFETQERCVAAAKEWKKRVDDLNKYNLNVVVMCSNQ
jgi:hypothetical protein